MSARRNSEKIKFLVHCALIASLYTALSLVFAPISFGPIQFRISEMLSVLPYFTFSAIPGLFVGCMLSNILMSAVWADIVFGSLATLIAALIAYFIRRFKYAVGLPSLVINTTVIPFVLKFGYGINEGILILATGVAIGQTVTAVILGTFLLTVLEKSRVFKK